jgi:hypothetical protein
VEHPTTIAVDLAKSVFEVAVSKDPGRVCGKYLSPGCVHTKWGQSMNRGSVTKSRRFLWLVTALSLGCASRPRAEDSVRIIRDPEFVRGCQPVGLLGAASSTAGAKSQSYYESYEARRDSENQRAYLRYRAAKLGGDVVLVTDEKPDRVTGQAYRCNGSR